MCSPSIPHVIFTTLAICALTPLAGVFLFAALYGASMSFCVTFFGIAEWAIQPDKPSIATQCKEQMWNRTHWSHIVVNDHWTTVANVIVFLGMVIGIAAYVSLPFIVAHEIVATRAQESKRD